MVDKILKFYEILLVSFVHFRDSYWHKQKWVTSTQIFASFSNIVKLVYTCTKFRMYSTSHSLLHQTEIMIKLPYEHYCLIQKL